MKKVAMAVVLVCALSTSIFAGNMPTGGKTEEPPALTTTSSTSGTLLVSVILTLVSLR